MAPSPPDWPRYAKVWLEKACEIANESLPARLSRFNRIDEIHRELSKAGIYSAKTLAEQLMAIPDCFLNRIECFRWFRETAYIQALMALPMTPLMERLLEPLAREPRRLVIWLYAFAPDRRLLAGFFGRSADPEEYARRASLAYKEFRAVLTAKFHEDDPAFPPPSGWEAWLIPDSRADSSESRGDAEEEGE
jgi:hypothetical protein